MKRIVLALLAGLLLSFGAKADPAFYYESILSRPAEDAEVGDYSKIKTVAVLSSIGQKALWGRGGLFGDPPEVDIRAWGVDDLVEAALRRVLAGRFTIVDASFDRASVPYAPAGTIVDPVPRLKKYFSQHPAAVDAYILVHPITVYDFEVGLTYDYDGTVYARYQIDIIDAHTYALIGSCRSRIQFRADGIAHAAALESVSLRLKKDMPMEQQLAKMKSEFEALVSMSLLETLRALKLGIALPPIGGRSTYPTPPGKEDYASIKSVAVASAIGDQLELANPGFFPNILKSDNHLAIDDMKIDEQVEQLARDILSRRFTVKDVTVDRAALAKARLYDKDEKRASTVAGLPVSNDIDAYIVFVKTPGNSPYPWHGTGMVSDWRERPTGAAVFTYYQMVIVDPRTLKPGDWIRGQPSLAWPRDVPWRSVDPKLWPGEKATSLTPQQHDEIAKVLHEEIADSVPETLLIMGLTDQSISFHSFLKP